MKPKLSVNAYQKTAIETASPGKITLMLYDGTLRFLSQAHDAYKQPQSARRNEEINNNIIRVLNIVTELQNSLDHSVKSDLPKTLSELYDYIYRKLSEANIQKDLSCYDEIEGILKKLRDSWAEMLLQSEKEKENSKPPAMTSLSLQA